eukprot:1717662-Prymnesium_polylepis.1
MDVDAFCINEAHGTGTALGDPIEAGSLAAAVLSERQDITAPLELGGIKANVGHAEAAAGMTGLIKLALELQVRQSTPNAQLRLINPHVSDALQNLRCALSTHFSPMVVRGSSAGGLSSFGYAGTIVHQVLAHTDMPTSSSTLSCGPALVFRRRAFPWRPREDTSEAIVPASLDRTIVEVLQQPAGSSSEAASSETPDTVSEEEGVLVDMPFHFELDQDFDDWSEDNTEDFKKFMADTLGIDIKGDLKVSKGSVIIDFKGA